MLCQNLTSITFSGVRWKESQNSEPTTSEWLQMWRTQQDKYHEQEASKVKTSPLIYPAIQKRHKCVYSNAIFSLNTGWAPTEASANLTELGRTDASASMRMRMDLDTQKTTFENQCNITFFLIAISWQYYGNIMAILWQLHIFEAAEAEPPPR